MTPSAARFAAIPQAGLFMADHAEMHQIGDEYSGSVHLAIYEHWTSVASNTK